MYRTTRLAMLVLVVAASIAAIPAGTAAMDAQTGTDTVPDINSDDHDARDEDGGETTATAASNDSLPSVGGRTMDIVGKAALLAGPNESDDALVVGGRSASASHGHAIQIPVDDRTTLPDESPNDGSAPGNATLAQPTWCQSGITPFTDNVGVVFGGNCWMIENDQLWIVGDCEETATVNCYGMVENDDDDTLPAGVEDLENATTVDDDTLSATDYEIERGEERDDTVRARVTFEGVGADRTVTSVPLALQVDGERQHLGRIVAVPTDDGVETGFVPADDAPESTDVGCKFYSDGDGGVTVCEFGPVTIIIDPGTDDGSDSGSDDDPDDLPFPLRTTGPFLPHPT